MTLPLPELTEAEWQRQVVRLATTLGWVSYHTMPGRNGKGWTTPVTSRGFPDLLLVRPPRLLAVELKSATGKVTEEQVEWLDRLAGCGAETFVWRPADLDEVATVLSKRRAKVVL